MVRLDGAREKGLNSKHINAKWEKKKKKKTLKDWIESISS